MSPATRKSVPLTAEDTRGAESLRVDLAWRQAAREVAGVELTEAPSEAEAIHALVEVGRVVLAARVTEAELRRGYEALAQAQSVESDSAEDYSVSRAAGRRAARRAE